MDNMRAATAQTSTVRADGNTGACMADCLLTITQTYVPTIAAKPGAREYRLGVNHV